MSMKEYTTDEIKIALLDLLDMHGAITGGAHELHGYGLPRGRADEIWELGQQLYTEKENFGWT